MAEVLKYSERIWRRLHAKLEKVAPQHPPNHLPKVPFCSQSNTVTLRALSGQSEMQDRDRDARTAFEWQQSVLAYVEFRMGDSWRRLHRPGQRFNEVRQHWLDVWRTCSNAFNAHETRATVGSGREPLAGRSPLPSKKPPQSTRLAAAIARAAKISVFLFALLCVTQARAAEPDACDDAKAKLIKILSGISNRPQGWHWVVACNEVAWRADLRKYDSRETNSAFTVRSLRLTVVNIRVFDGVEAESIIRHEIGHVRCACDDENEATKRGKE